MKFKYLMLREDFYEIDGKEFYDYETGKIDRISSVTGLPYGFDIFDKTTIGGYPKYTRYLPDNIVMMSPNEYFERCAKGFGTSVSTQINGIEQDKDILQHLKDVLTVAKRKLPLCYISDSDGAQQEGRHRMCLAGNLYGWSRKFPVLLVP